MDVKDEYKNFPDRPGIYLFFNKQKELIYVGKATSLRSRVGSYWRLKISTRPIESMMHEVYSVKYQETDSVLEAIILEANTIKKFLPRYNVLGKDNKSWNYIVITNDAFPEVQTLRQHDYETLKQKNIKTLKHIKYLFGPYPGLNMRATMKILRTMFHFSTCRPKQSRPCLYYQMGQCLGVCTGEITSTEYKKKVIQPLVLFLKGQKKKLILSLEREMKSAAKSENFEEAQRIRDQLQSLHRIHDMTLINRSMVGLDGGSLLTSPDRGGRFAVSRIEGYDISNLGTTGKVGSMVVFDSAGSMKDEYRKFKIQNVAGQSDVDCLEEVLVRRLKHSEWSLPSIILIDGGRPQVNRAEQVLSRLHLSIPIVGIAKGPARKKNQFVFGVSSFESKTRALRQSRQEFVYWVESHQNLLIQVRDEAHRFAITYQRSLRKINK